MTTLDSTAVEALGWALVHFAWQGVVAAAVFAVLNAAAHGAGARVRYALAAFTLSAMAVMPPLTVLVTRAPGREIGPTAASGPAVRSFGAVPIASARTPAIDDRSALEIRARIANALPAIVALWCAGVLVLSIRYLGGWRLVQQMDKSARPILDGEVAGRLARLLRRMRVSRPVRLLESTMVEVPTVVGWLRPAILLPAATMAGLTAEQLEAILAHELAHVRRYDYLASLLQSAVETILFYHPAVWWVSHRMRVERELCCDDEAVAACGNPIEYARALAGLEALRPAPRLAPAAAGGPLFERVARLVAAPSSHGVRASRGAAALLGCAALALALMGVTTLRASVTGGQGEPEPAKRRAPATKQSPEAPTAATTTTPGRPSPPRPSGTDSAPAANGDRAPSTRLVPVERLMELAGAGVTPDYVDGMAALGYPNLSWDQLIELRRQGVGPEYVRGLAQAGHPHLTPEQLVSLRTQGVSPDFVRGLAAEGLKDLSLSELLELRTQGVSPEYVRNLRAAGYADLSVTDLLAVRSNGVSPEDAMALRAMGYTDLSLGRLVGLRTMGVSAEYVRGLQAQGYKGLSAPMLIGLRSQGVTVEYVRELKELGYAGLAAGELIELRSHGVTPGFVRDLKDAGYDRLTTRELIDLRSHGVDPALLKRLKGRGEPSR
ncbi:MAG TPA: M56 family metallopeptidase [Vicinamibacteria bacterium]|nr:M56 family metallopeptidase [Vicinamibacteria bacterium]